MKIILNQAVAKMAENHLYRVSGKELVPINPYKTYNICHRRSMDFAEKDRFKNGLFVSDEIYLLAVHLGDIASYHQYIKQIWIVDRRKGT